MVQPSVAQKKPQCALTFLYILCELLDARVLRVIQMKGNEGLRNRYGYFLLRRPLTTGSPAVTPFLEIRFAIILG